MHPTTIPFAQRARHEGLRATIGIVLLALACDGGVDGRMGEIRSLQESGRFEASITELREVLDTSPELPEANYRLGLALVQTGEPSRAVWPLQKAAESSDYAISAGVLLASTHFQTRNFDEAIRAATRVLEADPERQAALRIRANAHLAARQLEAAFADTSRLVASHPDDYGVRALHATVLGDLGRLDEAQREHEALKRMGEASDDPAFRDRACLAPAAFTHEVLEDVERARSLYEECAAHRPTDTVVVNHLASFFDAVEESERGTELWRDAVAQAPDRLALHQGLAARLEHLGQSDEAERVLRTAVERLDSAAAWNLLASFYRARNQPQQALEAIEKVMELTGGGDERVRFVMVDLLIDLGEIERASQLSEEITQDTYAQLLRGRIHLVKGNPRAALESFEQGIRAWPNNASARFLAGIAARDLGDSDRAISELREAVRANNGETDAALELARILLERGDYQQAVTFSNLALRGRGAGQAEPYAIAARALTALGQGDRARRSTEMLEKRGHSQAAWRERILLERRLVGPERALEVAEQSGLDLSDPAYFEVLEQVVETELIAQRSAQAIERIDLAVARAPEDMRLHTLRGAALAAAGREDDARLAYERALELAPASAPALAGQAALRAEAGDTRGAVELFDRAYAASPREGGYAYKSAQLLLATGESDEAERRLRQVVEKHPGVVGARNDLAWLLAERGEQLDLALRLAREARRVDPSSPILDTLGWVHYQRGEYAEAVQVLEAAVDAAPDSPSMRYRLGLALEQTGDRSRAREMFEAAITAGSFPEAEAARRQLAQLAGS